MKNYRLYPFERNRFFYGKLLTVRDFETEQKYFNDKRRIINRLIHGSGVLCGLQVVAVDDKTISVEAGVALDQAGREIVVANPVTQKLSMIDGFTNNDYIKNVFLCIEYDEKGKEAVHSVAGTSTDPDGVSEYNRIQESYRLFIREEAPELSDINFSGLMGTSAVIYSSPQLKVWQEAPKYVRPDEEFEVCIKIEKAVQVQKVSLELDMELEGLFTADNKNAFTVTFAEPGNSRKTEYEVKFRLRAGPAVETPGKITAAGKGSKLKEGDKSLKISGDSSVEIQVEEEPSSERILRKYYGQTLDKCLEYKPEQCIYIAKIALLQVGPTFIIEKVEQVPFKQYVYNTSLLNKLGRDNGRGGGTSGASGIGKVKAEVANVGPEASPNVKLDFDKESGEMNFKFEIPTPKVMFGDITTGYADISLGTAAKSGDCFYSEEIDHNLGVGNVFVVLGVVDSTENLLLEMANEEEKIFMGDSDVFSDSPNAAVSPSVSLGSVIYPKKGKFIIGAKLKSMTKQKSVRVRWWAYRKLSDAGREGEVGVFVDPATIEIGRGESFKFQSIVTGTKNKKVIWSVKQKHGGSIKPDGLYKAPDAAGTFEVEAYSEENPLKSGTALIVVKDKA